MVRNNKSVTELMENANAFCTLKRYNKAIECCDKALELEPDNAQTLFFRGFYLFLSEGDTNEALKWWEKSIEIDPKVMAVLIKEIEKLSKENKVELKEVKENLDAKKNDYYEVVLSFAGEEREYVKTVAKVLKSKNVRVFYDYDEDVNLWGKDLSVHLDEVYGGKARYCVMFISKNYAEKIWTNHEKKSALAKSIEQKGEYILPVRFDDTRIPGIQPTIAYLDISKMPPEELGRKILLKLGKIE